MRRAQANGSTAIVDVCDNHYAHPTYGEHYRAMSLGADQVVCNTPEMADAARPFCRRPPIVIEDPYEGPKGAFEGLSAPLRLLWFGHPTNLDSLQACLDDLIGYARTQAVSLRLLTQASPALEAAVTSVNQRHAPYFQMAFEPWSLPRQWAALAACDAVIIPSLQNERKRVKSANRMIEALWAGRPVVAQPMPAYLPFERWTPVRPTISEGLAQLLAEREQIAPRLQAAQAFIDDRYSPARIGGEWRRLIEQQPSKDARHEA